MTPTTVKPAVRYLSFTALLVLAASAGCVSPDARAGAESAPQKPLASGFAPIHGIRMHYELYGPPDAPPVDAETSPVPLVLLHGGGSLRTIRARTLVVLGDRDVVKPEHGVELTRLIPDARLLVLPGGHGDYLGELVMTQGPSRYPELTAGLIEEFLDAP